MIERAWFLVLALALLGPGASEAEVVLRRVEGVRSAEEPGRWADAGVTSLSSLAADKADVPQTRLYLPIYFVDPAAGDTTLFAVRNPTENEQMLEIEYFGVSAGDLQFAPPPLTLGPREVVTVNLRDVQGNLTPPAPFRGFVAFSGSGLLTGDYLQVNVGENLATGERLIGPDELCRCNEIRFFQGQPLDRATLLHLFIDDPRGRNPGANTPTAVVDVFDEAGTSLGTFDLFTDLNVVSFDVSEVTAAGAGVIEVDFSSTRGTLSAEYSAAGRFSVGVSATCTDQERRRGPCVVR